MAIKKMTIKRNDNGTVDTLYPRTTVDQIYDSTGANAFVDGNGKINETFLPTSVFGGMHFMGTITTDTTVTALSALANTYKTNTGVSTAVGLYWIVGGLKEPYSVLGAYNSLQTYYETNVVSYNNYWYQAKTTVPDGAGNAPSGGNTENFYWAVMESAPTATTDGPTIKVTGLTNTQELTDEVSSFSDIDNDSDYVQAGDWVIITADGGESDHTFRVINNTYSLATTTSAGIMSAADKSKLNGIAANANNYSLPLASNTVRGGIKIGYSSTETNRAVVLSSEQGYVSLPRTIPNLTVNGTAVGATQVDVYAPTSVGSSGQIVQSDGDGAPNWVDYTAIFYGEYTDNEVQTSADGTLFFELDA